MKNKKWFVLILIVFVLIICFEIFRPKYDIDIMKRIISKYINTNETVELYNSIEFEDHRLVSYTLKDSKGYKEVGYAHILYNNKNKYEILEIIEPDKVIEKSSDIRLYEFSTLKSRLSSLNLGEFTINTSIFIISNDPELDKIEQIMPDGEIQNRKISSSPSINFFDVLEEDNQIEYKFYNKDGNIIK